MNRLFKWMPALLSNTKLNNHKTIIICALLSIQSSVFACSIFTLAKGRELIVGNNDDWFCNVAYLMVNPRGMTKQNFLSSAGKKLEWTSKYGSVTINFNYLGAASGGMNEAGLVIDEAWPGHCRYPAPDDRPPFDEAQWIQYQFDNCSTVDEVIQTDSKLRVVSFFGQSHYFVCDQSGKAAVIEWIDGKMVVHILTGDNVPVLTNDDYDWSLSELQKCKGFGGDKPIGNSPSSLDRFCRAAEMVKRFATNNDFAAVDYGFDILENVSQPSTMFNWVYDISNRTICYKTAQSREIKKVPLNRFDISSNGPMLMADILTTKSGDITGNFEPFTPGKSRDFVTRVVKRWREEHFAMHITDAEVEKMIQYPETMRMAAVLFEDPLDGRTVPGWIVPPAPFAKTPAGDTAFLLTSGTPGLLAPPPWVGDESWRNYRLTVEILPAREEGFLGVDFNVRKSDGCGGNLHFSTFREDDTLMFQPMRFSGPGSESWKLWPLSQRKIPFPRDRWIRLRIDVGETVANAYIDDDAEPLCTFYDLPSSSGGVRFWASWGGSGYYRNLRVTRLSPQDVKPLLADIWAGASRQNVLRDWRATGLQPAGFGADGLPAGIHSGKLEWKPIKADRRGVVDLSATFQPYDRNTVYAETVVKSDQEVVRSAWVTYTDRFTLYCNGKEVFKGPDRHWFSPDREKYGNSRLIPDQFEVRLPLKAGENKLLVRSEALEQFGWAFWMRLD